MGYPKRSSNVKARKLTAPKKNVKGRKLMAKQMDPSIPEVSYPYNEETFFVPPNASTADPFQQEMTHASVDEANDRRAVRQAIMTQLLSEIADEIIGSGQKLGGDLEAYFRKGGLKRLHGLIYDTEAQFNGVRDRLNVGRDFGSINLMIFANAMALGDIKNPDRYVDPEEVARRVVIRAGLSGYQRTRKDDGNDP